MKLLINTESLKPPLTGIGNYTFNLLQQFSGSPAFEAIDCFSGYRLMPAKEALHACAVSAERHATQQATAADFSSSRLSTLLRSSALAYRAREVLRNGLLRSKRSQLRGHVYHEPNFILKNHAGPKVATIHDLSFIRHPEFHPAKRVDWLTSELPKTLACADFLITDSDQVRTELLQNYAIDETRVRRIHLGAAPEFIPRSAEQTRTVLAKHGLRHGEYLLFVGTLEPRKGVDILLAAWSSLPSELKRRFPLVLAGANGWHNAALQKQMESLMDRDGLRYLRFVAAADLPTLYAGARVFVYPSRYEGFGLPVLEAMSCGTPVICTAGTSMSEITGTCALHIENENTEQLREQIQRLAEDDTLQRQVGQAGLARSKDFSWAACAQETQDVYRLIGG